MALIKTSVADGIGSVAFDNYPHRNALSAELVAETIAALFPAPVIAMIDGSVWGGACDLVLDCDIALGDEAASFCFVPAKLGLPYNLSGVQRFVTRLPPNIAMEMACTAEPIDAERAVRVNLLNQLVPGADLETRTYAMARTIAGRHREAIAAFKMQTRLLMAAPAVAPERLEYVEAIRRTAYAAVGSQR